MPSQEEIERDTQMAVKVWRDYPFLYEEGGMIFGEEVSGSIPVRPDDVEKTKYCLMVGQDKTGECVGYAIIKIHIG